MPASARSTKVTASPPDPYVARLLEGISVGKRLLRLPKGETIFVQGDPADTISFIQSGKVKISVTSASGKEAILAILNPQLFW